MNFLYITAQRAGIDALTTDLMRTAPSLRLEYIETLREARERLGRPDRVDGVLFDLRMPDGDGVSLIPDIRKRSPDLPIVAVLGKNEKPGALPALKAGVDDYLLRDESFAGQLPALLDDVVERSRRPGKEVSPLRILYAGDADFARRHLTAPAGRLQIAPPSVDIDGTLRIVPRVVTPDTPLPVDVVLLEHAFPGVPAFELLKDIRARKLDVPIVIVIKPQNEDAAGPAMRLGAADCVVKSEGSFNSLAPRLENLVARHKILRERNELARRAQLLLAVIDTAPTCMVRLAADGKVLYVNTAGLPIFGVSRKELIGTSAYSFVIPADRDAARNLVKDVCNGERRSVELDIINPGGTQTRVEIQAVPFSPQSTGKAGALCVVNAVTERLTVDPAAGENEARLLDQLEGFREKHDAAERALAAAEARLGEMTRQHETDRESAERRWRETEQHLERTAEEERTRRTALEQMLAAAEAHAAEVIKHHDDERAAAHLTALDTESQLQRLAEDERTRRIALEQALADADARIAHTANQQAADQQAAEQVRRQAEEQLARLAEQEQHKRTELEKALAAAETHLAEIVKQHSENRAAEGLAALETERQLQHIVEEERSRNVALEHALADAEARCAALTEQQATHRHAADQFRLDAESQLARFTEEEQRKQAGLEQALAAAETRLGEIVRQQTAEREAGEQLRAETERHIERLVDDERGKRGALEAALAETEARLAAKSRELLDQLAAEQAIRANEGHLQDLVTSGQTRLEELQRSLVESQSRAERLAVVASEESGKRVAFEIALAESEARAGEAATSSSVRISNELAPFGICRCTVDGEILEANATLVAMLGWRCESDLTGSNLGKDVVTDQQEFPWFVEACRQGPCSGIDMSWKQKDGTLLVVRLAGQLVQREPDSSEVLELTAVDVTDIAAIEKELRLSRRMEAIGTLAADVAQTCQQLLEGTVRHCDSVLASLDDQDPRWADCLEVRRSAARAHQLTRQLATYSHRRATALGALDVNELLTTMESVLRRAAGEDIELTIHLGSPLGWVEAEAEQLERILLNLVVNCREAMPLGGRTTVETANLHVDRRYANQHPGLRTGPHVLISVGAVGCGIAVDAQSERAEFPSAWDSGEKGGLGLASVRGIVKQFGGQFWMESATGGEIRFSVCVPQSPLDRRRTGRQTVDWRQPAQS